MLSHRNKRESQRDKGFSVFLSFLGGGGGGGQRKPVILKAKIARPHLCLYIFPPSEQQAALSPTWWQKQTHDVCKMLHCVLFN